MTSFMDDPKPCSTFADEDSFFIIFNRRTKGLVNSPSYYPNLASFFTTRQLPICSSLFPSHEKIFHFLLISLKILFFVPTQIVLTKKGKICYIHFRQKYFSLYT